MNGDAARDIVAQALHSVAPELTVEELEPDDDLREAGGLDSMDFLNFMIALHDASGIDVPEQDYPRLATIEGAIAYVSART